jgi:hypothetical protein
MFGDKITFKVVGTFFTKWDAGFLKKIFQYSLVFKHPHSESDYLSEQQHSLFQSSPGTACCSDRQLKLSSFFGREIPNGLFIQVTANQTRGIRFRN